MTSIMSGSTSLKELYRFIIGSHQFDELLLDVPDGFLEFLQMLHGVSGFCGATWKCATRCCQDEGRQRTRVDDRSRPGARIQSDFFGSGLRDRVFTDLFDRVSNWFLGNFLECPIDNWILPHFFDRILDRLFGYLLQSPIDDWIFWHLFECCPSGVHDLNAGEVSGGKGGALSHDHTRGQPLFRDNGVLPI